ncbi:autotransporter outer membrane beta-barrel domain-containing protein [Tepidicaulis sp. LMO-SS28]|uniref:autotransporter outer membrane beta-barrel domain-containing protein n=1 Tax=Tepidicaulis sp. LMO-SS28 TaxID=3447455 RepID=UPI003EE4085D
MKLASRMAGAVLVLFPGAALASDQPSGAAELQVLVDKMAAGELDGADIQKLIRQREAAAPKFGVWANYRHVELDDDRPGNAKESDGNVYTLGVDYRVSPLSVIGLAVISQETEAVSDTGSAPTFGSSVIENEARGFMLYGRTFLGALPVDATFSYLDGDTDITDRSALAPSTQKSTTYNSYALSAGAQLLVYPIGSGFWLSEYASFTHSWGSSDDYLDVYGRYHDSQDYEIGTLGSLTTLNYELAEGVYPYLAADLSYDLYSSAGSPAVVLNPGGSVATALPYQTERDEFGYGFLAGISAELSEMVSLDASYHQKHWGSDLQSQSFGLTARLSF